VQSPHHRPPAQLGVPLLQTKEKPHIFPVIVVWAKIVESGIKTKRKKLATKNPLPIFFLNFSLIGIFIFLICVFISTHRSNPHWLRSRRR
jgi:L-asparagine transporter-like permease